MSDHDPFNEPETAHPRARELMTEPLFWDSVDEYAPFGSDEGSDAYYEWREWREENPDASVLDCVSWILDGRTDEYNASLHSDEQMRRDLDEPDNAFMAEVWDAYTLDTTIIAAVLGQLMDEGKIDSDIKPFAYVAIERQGHPLNEAAPDYLSNLVAVKRVVEQA